MKVLLVVDLQQEFKDTDGNYERILKFVKDAKNRGYDCVVGTVFRNTENSPFMRYNIWDGCLNGWLPLEYTPDRCLYKDTYGLTDYSILSKEDEYTIIGFDTDACVLKIALDMLDRNYNIKVDTEYCFSHGGLSQHKKVLKC